jgi:hypothetical protein
MIHLSSNMFSIFCLPQLIAIYSNYDIKSTIQTFFLIVLFLIFLIKSLFKKPNE